MRAWVTGATGQIGHRLCARLQHAGHEVVAFSRAGTEESTDYQWVNWDMSQDLTAPEKLAPPSVVFHLAAQTSAYQARDDLPKDVTTNVLGFVRLLDSLRETGSKPHVILTGAATEVGATKSGIIRDFDPEEPQTFYDVGKVTQRLYLKQCCSEGWVDGTTIQLPNVYGGAGQTISAGRGFINNSVRRALATEPLNYYSDGEYIRDFLYVDDAVSALISAMHHRDKVTGETFLVGTGVGTRIQDALIEIARQAERVTNKKVSVCPVFSPNSMYAIERRNTIVDSSRYTERTSWNSQVSLEDGIQKSIDDLLQAG